MSPTLLTQCFTAAALAGIRASWVLFTLALASRWGHFALPPSHAFLATPTGLALLGGFCVLEHFLERDEDLQDLLGSIQYALRGTGALVVAWAFRAPGLEGLYLPDWVVGLTAMALALATHHLRMRLYRWFYGFGHSLLSPRTWLLWLETGGLLGALAALILAPWLALTSLLLATLGSLALGLIRRKADRRLHRRPCTCGYHARKEASRCPVCRGDLEVQRWLPPVRAHRAPRS